MKQRSLALSFFNGLLFLFTLAFLILTTIEISGGAIANYPYASQLVMSHYAAEAFAFVYLGLFVLNATGAPFKGKYILSLAAHLVGLLVLVAIFVSLAVSTPYFTRFNDPQFIYFDMLGLWLIFAILGIVFSIIWIKKAPRKEQAISAQPAAEENALPPLQGEEPKVTPTPSRFHSPVPDRVTPSASAPVPAPMGAGPNKLPTPAAAKPVLNPNEGESRFDAHLIQLIGHNLLSALLIVVSFTIAFPWVYASHQRWLAKHTIIQGYHLHFDGTGGQLIGNWIKWVLFTIITFGIYGLWVPLKLKNWQVKRLSFRLD